MEKILIGGISAFLGFLGGLVTPLIKGEVEKRRSQQEYRKELIKTWRDAIEREQYEPTSVGSTFLSSSAYSSLRAHMDPDIVGKVEAPRTVYAGGGRGENLRKQILLDEVARIEKKWKLV